MEDLLLIYINLLGTDWKDDYIYEFIFSDNLEDIDGVDWDLYPASGQPGPPSKVYIKAVGELTTKVKFEVIQNSDTFAIWDAVDGVCALGWEDLMNYDIYPENRLVFSFGDKIKSVEDSLYEKDLVLDYKLSDDEFEKKDKK